jgi:hypothetical protein
VSFGLVADAYLGIVHRFRLHGEFDRQAVLLSAIAHSNQRLIRRFMPKEGT